MKEGRPSETAVLAAILRALHPAVDAQPWILNDELAGPLVGLNDDASLRAALRSFEEKLGSAPMSGNLQASMRSARVNVTLRARYAEDQLCDAMARGTSQYVILGAGFDSFAYRRPDLAGKLRVFEVDYPATQSRKRERLLELSVEIPPHLVFVPLDFEQHAILDALTEMGLRRDQATFFSWLGVTWYLSEEAIDRTLGQVAAAAGGSEIVFDYVLPDRLVENHERQNWEIDKSIAAAHGEVGRSCFEPAQLEVRLKEIGFSNVRDLGHDEANARYLADRTDGLRFSSRIHLMKARVGHSV